MSHIRKIILSLSISVALMAPGSLCAQEIIQIDPLFEYPMAPESLSSLEEKSDYLMEHFWDAMDFKSTVAVDQNALNHAMKVFATPLRFATPTKAEAATDKLIEKISKNSTLLTQFTKAAEEVFYGPRAEYWDDNNYLKFLDAFVKNKKIPAVRKEKYEKQIVKLRNTLIGQPAPTFNFTGKNGKSERYTPMSTPTILIFGDPTLPDWRMIRMKMETSIPLKQAVEQGKLNILYIVPFKMDSWEKELSNYPTTWTIGNAPDLPETLDIRFNPSVYYVGNDGKIVLKNTTIEGAVNYALNSLQ